MGVEGPEVHCQFEAKVTREKHSLPFVPFCLRRLRCQGAQLCLADIGRRISGMLTGGSCKTDSSDMTYATPFWWFLERIKANSFSNAHLNVVA